MNERILFFIKIYLSHTLFSKGWCFLCVRGEWKQGRTVILTQVLLTIAALPSHRGWGCSTMGHWGPKALCLPLAPTSASCPQLLEPLREPGYIIVSRPLASAVLPLIYTGASLDWRFGRGSIYNNRGELHYIFAQLAGTVEYTDCFSAEGGDPRNEYPGYDTKQSDGEVPVILELWRMQSTPSLLSLPGPLWPGVIAPDRVLSMGQIEVNCVFTLNWIAWNRTVYMFKNGFGVK